MRVVPPKQASAGSTELVSQIATSATVDRLAAGDDAEYPAAGLAPDLYRMGMGLRGNWPAAEQNETPRLTLEPLRVEHAGEMFPVLDDHSLHECIGREPLHLDQLRARYASQVAGHSPDGAHGWLNWIMRQDKNQAVVGTVQATLSYEEGRMSAEMAWIVAVSHQRRGYASQAAEAVVGWLRRYGVDRFHCAHQSRARSIGWRCQVSRADGHRRNRRRRDALGVW